MEFNPVNIAGRPPRILSREEELAAWEAGDHDALVESVWPFVLKQASQLARRDDAVFHELLSVAQLVIAGSIKSFDPKQSRFASYACRYVQLKMLETRHSYYSGALVSLNDIEVDGLATQNSDIDVIDDSEEDESSRLFDILFRVCNQREIAIVLAVCNGKSFAEIAAERATSRQNVFNWHKKAIQKCRQALSEVNNGNCN